MVEFFGHNGQVHGSLFEAVLHMAQTNWFVVVPLALLATALLMLPAKNK